MYKDKDVELTDETDPPHNTFARIEIVPKNGDYLRPDKWVYQIDERVKPNWLKKKHKDLAMKAHEQWKSELYAGIALDQFPENPFKIKAPEIKSKHIKLVKEWASVWDSVWDSVRASVWASVWASVGASVRVAVEASVGDSVWASVWDSVRDSVWDSVEASVYGQIGAMFPKIKKWEYTENVKIKGYPFKSAVKLWRMGLVPVYYQNKWHLYGSPKGNGKVECLWKEK